MSNVKRIYIEKKAPYAVKAMELYDEIHSYLGINSVTKVREFIRYDIENISEEIYKKALGTVFSEPPIDDLYEEVLPDLFGASVFGVEFLPGQFDQRADSAEQCVKLLNEEENPTIKTATIKVIEGNITSEELLKIKNFCINSVDSREANSSKPATLITEFEDPKDIEVIDGFINFTDDKLNVLYSSLNLAMTYADFKHIQAYFANDEKRNPTMTEIRVLDTYWSDHCRHTTFLTELKNISFEEGFYNQPIVNAYNKYLAHREEVFKGRDDKYVCLMDIALMAMRKLKKDGKLEDLEQSEEINACSIVVPVEIDGLEQEWLISFKNETHNHPTEIEPFGGAATCLGGAIRDPLSGRSYVYQAMRVTGASDPTVPVSDTLSGKLPQRKISTGATKGYSSYGNQIGLATGYVNEVYHPNYVAKRMEIGAVIGASPRENVIRETSDPGDIIILLGGRTGRDGCGGATGSSKVHTEESISTCGAEVQKGNAPTERKIQRLFRKEKVSKLIKKCNDFGAGGVSVAIGELAEGLHIFLDKLPKKYAGLDGTELSISESQERMAVVIDPKDVKEFLVYADEENLEAVEVAVVTKEPRLVMIWRDKTIVDINRAFLDTNGAHLEVDIEVKLPAEQDNYFNNVKAEVSKEEAISKANTNNVKSDITNKWLELLSDLNVCSQKGMVEHFDSSIGGGTVLMPYGGKYQLSPIQTMVSKLPVLNGATDTVTMMSYGFDPFLSSWSPFHGAIYAIIHSVSKIVATGGNFSKIRFTFQEYFKRLGVDKTRWSEPFAALLGAYEAQIGLGLPSIGGKDSMSGTFNDIDVPPTLVSFAVDVASHKNIISPEFKQAGNKVVLFQIEKDEFDIPVFEQLKKVYANITKLIEEKKIISAYAIGYGGIAEAVSKMAFGNKFGVKINDTISEESLFAKSYGNIVAEVPSDVVSSLDAIEIGNITIEQVFNYKNASISMDEAIAAWSNTLEEVYPTVSNTKETNLKTQEFNSNRIYIASNKIAKPKVFIPVFPGTNCEYDSARAFEAAGAVADIRVFKNLTPDNIRDSVDIFEEAIRTSQIIMFPGGFSAGDEPDGSGKFIATAFRNERLKEAVLDLLYKRDGLALGICNGFQALIKLGLLPYGDIIQQTDNSPTLTMNTIGRHISKMIHTKITSNDSPWLSKCKVGDIHVTPISHGEGRFVANDEWIKKLFENGQVATQYVDLDGAPSMNEVYNPNGSYYAIEGITSPDGKILGKMSHSERKGTAVAINIVGNKDQYIFESGVEYFK
ncbi:MAG: phosphoribosylformylglycinamidine synthase [Clostridiales bacterium]|jgi:phosphoribosylformylglycinamidine synthase|nr:phosphoribosylformylglycinamidine synthase [Clostridiales bacterium]